MIAKLERTQSTAQQNKDLSQSPHKLHSLPPTYNINNVSFRPLMFFFFNITYGPTHEILVLIAYAQIPLTNDYADASSGTRDLDVGLSLNLHPYFLYASREGPGMSKNARIQRGQGVRNPP